MAAMRELCSGRIPQNAILCRARVDPVAVLGAGDYGDQFYACPPNVPLFTTEEGLRSLAPGGAGMNVNGKRGRTAGDEAMIPVIAHIPEGADLNGRELIFVGISYNAGSRSRPVVSVATGGQMPIPHEETGAEAHLLIGAQCWWQRSTLQYGSTTNFYIAVPKPAAAAAPFVAADTRALCGIMVQQATGMDCAVLLGVPPF